MIHLDLGAEPAELKAKRETLLPQAVAAFNTHGPDSDQLKAILDKGYTVVKAELRRRQKGKCAFCEHDEDAYKRPVEHFRPKKGAEDKIGTAWTAMDPHYYWWLCWTWENLFFSCDTCNQTGNKGNRFPIEPGSARMHAPTQPATYPLDDAFFDTSAEQRLLIDPRRDEPLDHLKWKPVDSALPFAQWTWTLDGTDLKGTTTIDVLDLRRRLDLVNDRLGVAVMNAWIEIDKHIKNGRLADAQEGWERIVSTVIENPRQPFRGPAWWALQWLCPERERIRLGLRHPPRPYVTP